MPNLTVLPDTEANKALLDPKFRAALTLVSDIQKETGIDCTRYDSVENFIMAALSRLDTKTLEIGRRRLALNGTPDDFKDITMIDAVIEARVVDAESPSL